MARVFVRPRARRDLREILVYYIDNAGIETAHRFTQAASQTFRELANFRFRACVEKYAVRNFMTFVCGGSAALRCTSSSISLVKVASQSSESCTQRGITGVCSDRPAQRN